MKRFLPEIRIAVFKPGRIKSLTKESISGLKPAALNALSKRQVQVLTEDQLAGLSRKQIKKSNDFIDGLSAQQLEALSFNVGHSSRLIDPAADNDELLLSGFDPLTWSISYQ